ncbi:MAG: hypothetical protein R2762_13885 [Bryobacteraceae bacterium]
MKRVWLAIVFAVLLGGEESGLWLDRVEPLGAQRGTVATVTISGEHLVQPTGAWFDTGDIE